MEFSLHREFFIELVMQKLFMKCERLNTAATQLNNVIFWDMRAVVIEKRATNSNMKTDTWEELF